MPSQVKERLEKSYPASFKAVDESTGTFEAIVAVFGNVDLIGDRIVKGAFQKSLGEWKSAGDPIPVIWSHMWSDPNMHIGKTLEAEEREEGLWVKGQLDMEDPFAAKVFKLMQQRRVKEFSFAYDVEDEGKADDGANDLKELKIIEVGPTLKGMNPATQLLATKKLAESVGLKAGRVLSKKNESDLKSAVELIQGVLAQLAQADEDEAKAEEPEQVKTQPKVEVEEPAEVKAEEPDLVAELFRSALAVGAAT
jgi:HK97 family phage prohead protease